MTPRLGDVLIELGFITPDQLAAGLERQQEDRRRLGEVLVSMGIIAEDKLAKALWRQTGVEEWDPRRTPVHERVIATFPAALAIRYRVFPVAMQRTTITVTWCIATTDPTDETTRSELGNALCTPDEPVVVTWLVSTPSNIEAGIREHYSAAATVAEPSILIEEPVEHVPAASSTAPEQARPRLARIRIERKRSAPG